MSLPVTGPTRVTAVRNPADCVQAATPDVVGTEQRACLAQEGCPLLFRPEVNPSNCYKVKLINGGLKLNPPRQPAGQASHALNSTKIELIRVSML